MFNVSVDESCKNSCMGVGRLTLPLTFLPLPLTFNLKCWNEFKVKYIYKKKVND